MTDEKQPRKKGTKTRDKFDSEEYWRSFKKATFTDYKIPPQTYEEEWGDRLVGVEAIVRRSFEHFDVFDRFASGNYPYTKSGLLCVSNWTYIALEPVFIFKVWPGEVDPEVWATGIIQGKLRLGRQPIEKPHLDPAHSWKYIKYISDCAEENRGATPEDLEQDIADKHGKEQQDDYRSNITFEFYLEKESEKRKHGIGTYRDRICGPVLDTVLYELITSVDGDLKDAREIVRQCLWFLTYGHGRFFEPHRALQIGLAALYTLYRWSDIPTEYLDYRGIFGVAAFDRERVQHASVVFISLATNIYQWAETNRVLPWAVEINHEGEAIAAGTADVASRGVEVAVETKEAAAKALQKRK